jgi:hypothetical protein
MAATLLAASAMAVSGHRREVSDIRHRGSTNDSYDDGGGDGHS